MSDGPPPLRVGVVGTGFVGRRFVRAWQGRQGIRVGRILTRRRPEHVTDAPLPEALTTSPDQLIADSDILLECSGDPVWATEIIDRAFQAGLPVVTMNAELHVTTGSWLSRRGRLSEAEGDQPGAQAAWLQQIREMGFEPWALVNLKGFLNRDPTPADMAHWAGRQRISLPMVTASTDGTKVQVEQALVANHAGATILAQGLRGPADADWQRAARALAEEAQELGRPIADYVLAAGAPHGVAIVATHQAAEAEALGYFKLGPGPLYVLLKPNIFVHLEIPRTLRQLAAGGPVLMDNGPRPEIGMAAIAKRALPAGHPVPFAIGSFDFRGEAVRICDQPDHLPIGLLQNAVLRRRLAPGQMVAMDDVELEDSLALRAWLDIKAGVIG